MRSKVAVILVHKKNITRCQYFIMNGGKGSYTKEEGMQLPMVAIQTAKCKSLLKIATFSISAWAGEDWTFVALWFCVVVESSGVLGECI